MQWEKADLEEKGDSYVVNAWDEHKPNSAQIVWDDLVVNGVTIPEVSGFRLNIQRPFPRNERTGKGEKEKTRKQKNERMEGSRMKE